MGFAQSLDRFGNNSNLGGLLDFDRGDNGLRLKLRSLRRRRGSRRGGRGRLGLVLRNNDNGCMDRGGLAGSLIRGGGGSRRGGRGRLGLSSWGNFLPGGSHWLGVSKRLDGHFVIR